MNNPLEWLTEGHRRSYNNIIEMMPPLTGKIRRILLLSDIHANWEALAQVLEHAQGLYDTTWFLGDVIGYGPQPIECLKFLRERLSFGGRWVAGNHDLEAFFSDQLNNSGHRVSEEAKWSRQKHLQMMGEQGDLLAWFRESVAGKNHLPKSRHYGEFSQIFVHANLDNFVDDNLFPDYGLLIQTRLRNLLSNNRASKRDFICVFVGHTHMVTLIHLPGKSRAAELLPIPYGVEITLSRGAYLINPGSVGQPRDGDPRAAYAILDIEKKTITFHRVEYDVVLVQSLLREGKYPEELVRRLGNGRIRRTAENFEHVYKIRQDRTGVDVR